MSRYCKVDGCSTRTDEKGFCRKHLRRWERHGDPSISLVAEYGTGYINKNGYHVVRRGGKQVLQHRFVMESIMGRPLTALENVHHVNGDRADNRPENLELWSKMQPCGKRVTDLIAYAEEILSLYASPKEQTV